MVPEARRPGRTGAGEEGPPEPGRPPPRILGREGDAALVAWLIDYGDGDAQPAAAVVSALRRTTSATGELTRDEILDNITLF